MIWAKLISCMVFRGFHLTWEMTLWPFKFPKSRHFDHYVFISRVIFFLKLGLFWLFNSQNPIKHNQNDPLRFSTQLNPWYYQSTYNAFQTLLDIWHFHLYFLQIQWVLDVQGCSANHP
jgi:hypothetical protein